MNPAQFRLVAAKPVFLFFSLTTGDRPRRPLNEGVRLRNIAAARTGRLLVEEVARRGVLSEMKTTAARRWDPIREEEGSLDWITGHFQNMSSLTARTCVSCTSQHLRENRRCTAFSSHSTTCNLKPRPNIWSWRNTALSTLGWMRNLPKRLLVYFSCNMYSSKYIFND